MSRSYRHNPFIPVTTADTEKKDKRFANRALRRVNRVILDDTLDQDKLLNIRDISNVWCFDKDGKAIIDPRKEPSLMRK